jgi:hypothetical protein
VAENWPFPAPQVPQSLEQVSGDFLPSTMKFIAFRCGSIDHAEEWSGGGSRKLDSAAFARNAR